MSRRFLLITFAGMINRMRILRPWQNDAGEYLLKRKQRSKGGMLYMEMRLGKSLAIINFINRLCRDLLPALILTPNPVKRTWGRELQSEGINDYLILDGTKEQRNASMKLQCEYTICNYESLIPFKKKVVEEDGTEHYKKYLGIDTKAVKFKSIICDESQRLSNPKSSITKFLLKEFPNVQYKYLLSGLPAPENESQYFTQFMLAHGHFLYYRNFWSFRAACYNQSGYDWILKQKSRDEIYDAIHENAFVRSRSDVGLPNLKEYTRRYVKMSPEQEKAYKSMLKTYKYKTVEATNDLSQLIFLQQLASGQNIAHPESPFLGTEKFELIKELLQGELRGDKIMIWSRFNAEAILVWKYLNLLGFSCALVHGETKDEDIENIRDQFNTGNLQIVSTTIKKSSTGTNWSGADTAIYISNEFSNDLRSQSEDRIYDVSKSYPLLIIDLITEKTIDESVVDGLVEKKIDSKFFLSHLYGEVKAMALAN